MFRKTTVASVIALTLAAGPAAYGSGTLDPSFSGGVVTTDLGTATDAASDVVVQSDGKLVVAGRTGSDVVLLRYNIDGTLDTDFGQAGKVVEDLGSEDVAGSVTLQPTGEIIVAARSYTPGTRDHHTVVLRYLADGRRDATFGTGGKVSVPIGLGSFPRRVFVSPDGGITLWLRRFDPNWREPVLARYPEAFPTILRFDRSGRPLPGLAIPEATGVDMQPDGKLLVAATYGRNDSWVVGPQICIPFTSICAPVPGMPTGFQLQDLRVVVFRFLAQGMLDPTFAHGGVATIDASPPTVSNPSGAVARVQGNKMATSLVAAQPDGHVILAFTPDAVWRSDNPWLVPYNSYELLRLDPDGSIDGSYNTSQTSLGMHVIDLQTHAEGAVSVLVGSSGYQAIKRFLPGGEPDRGFGGSGTAPVPDGGVYSALTTQPDGKLVISGSYATDYWREITDISLARYLVSPTTEYTLRVESIRDKGTNYAYLTWTGPSGDVDVYRDGIVIAVTSDTAFTDTTTKGKGTFVYQVCQTGTANCSQEVSVTF